MSRTCKQLAALLSLSMGAAIATSAAFESTPINPPTLNLAAVKTGWASRAVLLGVASAGQRLVAVGERGFILLSDDSGKTWRQASMVPTSVTLTRVAFATEREGWVVGHMGIVLHTVDGGETWNKQLDGTAAAEIALGWAQKQVTDRNGDSQALEAAVMDAEALVQDGPDKPFLALVVLDSNNALALGAFGYAFQTQDGGRHWVPIFDRLTGGRGRHMYGAAGRPGNTVVAGEEGLFMREHGDGLLEAVQTPYAGTYFGVLEARTGAVVVFGLRGTAMRTVDEGSHWEPVKTGTTGALGSGLVLADGRLVLGAQDGQLLASEDEGRSFAVLGNAPQPVAGLAQASDGSLIVVGPRGISRVEIPKHEVVG